MPAGVVFSLVAWLAVGRRPGMAPAFALVQLAFTVVFVIGFVRSFAERQRRITACLPKGPQSSYSFVIFREILSSVA